MDSNNDVSWINILYFDTNYLNSNGARFFLKKINGEVFLFKMKKLSVGDKYAN